MSARSAGTEMSRPWFEREARLGLRLICEFWTHPAAAPRQRAVMGLEFDRERDFGWFVNDTPRQDRDNADVRGSIHYFENWAVAETWMRAG